VRTKTILFSLILGTAVLSTACGGGGEGAKSSADAKADLSAMQELEAIPQELDAEVAELTKPIDDTQALIDELANLPKKHGISAGAFASMAKASIDDGKVEVQADAELAAEAKAELEAALGKLRATVVALKSTPDKAASLTKKLATFTAKVPTLATAVTASATATAANPFADGDAKAKAQADLDGVKKAQEMAQKSLSDTQAKVTEVPALATTALAKLTASIATP
jgi:peptidoglycan hydrolase CwlO-like protein